MKAVLISIRPQWCELIMSRKKTLEVRKNRPKLETPFKVYIYCTKAPKGWYRFSSPPAQMDGHIVGVFTCSRISTMSVSYEKPERANARMVWPESCLTDRRIMDYLGKGKMGYGWHISDLKIYDTPKNLGEFYRACSEKYTDCSKCIDLRDNTCMQITKPPQSWCYVEELTDGT